jgi:glycosyltransferase involved in cell wall biosynthesis
MMSDHVPLVSVVLPTYNGRRFIEQSIDSVLSQSWRRVELLVVDDGSTDDTLDAVKNYDDPRLKIISHSKNQGLPEALNTGFRESSGEYLTWTSDDNWYASHAIQTMYERLRADDHLGMVYAGSYLVDESSTVIGFREPRPIGNFEAYPWNPVGPCFLYRRKVYDRVGEYDTRFRLVEDYDYWLRVHKEFDTGIIQKPLYYYRQHTGSLTSKNTSIPARRALDLLRHYGYLSLRSYLKWMGWLDHHQAFAAWKNQQDRGKTLQLVTRCFLLNPAHLTNRSMIYAFMWAIFGDRLYNKLKHIKDILKNEKR